MSSPNDLSFLPDDYLARKARRRANILCGSVSAIVLAAVGAAFAVTERSMADIERRHAQVDHAYTDAARRIEQARKLQDQQRRIVQHAELAASLFEKVPRSNVLAELTNALPSGVFLLDFGFESKPRQEPVQPSAFDQKKAALEAKLKADAGVIPVQKFDVHMHLTGVADNDVQVAQFLSRLNQSAILRDVNLVISDLYQPQGKGKGETLRRFQIEMMLNPDAEVKDLKATRTAAVELGH